MNIYLQERGVEIVFLKDHSDTSSAIGIAMFRMLAVLAEMERDLIVERTQAGLQAARKLRWQAASGQEDSGGDLKLYEWKDYSVRDVC